MCLYRTVVALLVYFAVFQHCVSGFPITRSAKGKGIVPLPSCDVPAINQDDLEPVPYDEAGPSGLDGRRLTSVARNRILGESRQMVSDDDDDDDFELNAFIQHDFEEPLLRLHRGPQLVIYDSCAADPTNGVLVSKAPTKSALSGHTNTAAAHNRQSLTKSRKKVKFNISRFINDTARHVPASCIEGDHFGHKKKMHQAQLIVSHSDIHKTTSHVGLDRSEVRLDTNHIINRAPTSVVNHNNSDDHVADHPIVRPVGRPRKQPSTTQTAPLLNPDLPLTEWSFTLGANGRDCPIHWLHRLHAWMEQNHLEGIASLEKGSRNQKLHIQAAVRLPLGTTTIDVAKLKKHLKEFFPISTEDASKFQIKPFSEGQTWVHMLGYCQKDFGKPHYQMRSSFISEADLEAARAAYADIQPIATDDRIVLYPKSMQDRILSYATAHFSPFWVPVDMCLCFMMQTGRYVPSGDWMVPPRGYGADIRKWSIFEKMVMRPRQCTLDEIQCFFFDLHKSKFCMRYFASHYSIPTLDAFQDQAAPMLYNVQEFPELIEEACRIMRTVLADNGITTNNAVMINYNFVDNFFLQTFPSLIKEIFSLHGIEYPVNRIQPIREEHHVPENNDAPQDFIPIDFPLGTTRTLGEDGFIGDE